MVAHLWPVYHQNDQMMITRNIVILKPIDKNKSIWTVCVAIVKQQSKPLFLNQVYFNCASLDIYKNYEDQLPLESQK